MPAEANSGMRPLPNKGTVQPWWYGAGYGAHSPAQFRPQGLPAAFYHQRESVSDARR